MMCKILVVDDEKAICDSLKKFLIMLGHDVTAVQNGKDALEFIRNGKFDIVFLDIRMPEMDGIQVIKEIKKIDERVGIVMTTAVKEDKVALECMKLGAYDYITKPFDLNHMENVILAKLVNLIDK